MSVFIGDNEYYLKDTNTLNYLHIATTVRGRVPLLTLNITDVQHGLDSIGLQDGIPIRVVIKPSGKDTRTYSFRKFNHKRDLVGGAYDYTIYGYWDAPLYWNSTTAKGIRGTSDSVLAEVANTCGIKYDGVATNDSQLWLPQNLAYSAFAKEVALNGWVNDSSCMCIGLDLDATLRYKNVNDLPPSSKKILAYQYAEDSYTALDVSVSASSGFNNAVTGYQNMRYAQSTTENLAITQIKDLAFTPNSRSPLYNVALKDKLQRGPVRFGPIDVGNVHPNYERASYQNTRYRNLFSMGLDMLFQQLTDFKLLEQVSLSVQREDTGQDASHSGVYTVSGRAIYIQGASYSEKLSVVRHGSNETYTEG